MTDEPCKTVTEPRIAIIDPLRVVSPVILETKDKSLARIPVILASNDKSEACKPGMEFAIAAVEEDNAINEFNNINDDPWRACTEPVRFVAVLLRAVKEN